MYQHGATTAQLEQKTGIRPEQLENLDNRIPLDKHIALWHAAIELTGNPAFALHLGENARPDDMGIISLVIMNAPNLGEMYSRVMRYTHLIAECDRFELYEQPDQVHLRYDIEVPEYFTTYAIERSFAIALSWSNTFTGATLNPLEMQFQYKAPEYLSEYKRIFKTTLNFEHQYNAIVLDKAELALPNKNYNNYLDNIANEQAQKLLNNLSTNNDVVRQTYKLIVEHLPTGNLNVDTISSDLHMSRRTLARKLNKEGLTFQELVERTKKDLSLNYLKQNSISINDIAYMLGFSETSAFSRAFKRWFGDNPQSYRRSINVSIG